MQRFAITLLVILSIVFSTKLSAQKPSGANITGDIKGIVYDADTTKPLLGANITLFNQSDMKAVGGDISNKDGSFHVEKIAPGRYNLKINYIGYRVKEFRSIIVSEKKHTFNIGKIKMEQGDVMTGVVEVTADKEMMQLNFDRKVYNVDKNLTAQGGSAVDAMKNIPSITVDIDNNISVRGSQNVTILVDGKPSGLANSDLLDMIPASTIDRIELITNPSAKFDPDGNAGMINIVLKKEKQDGMNGMLQMNAGTGDKYNASINFNMRTGDFNLFGSYNNRYFSMNNTGYTNRANILPDSTYYLYQNEDAFRNGYNHNFRFGFDYNIDTSNTITLSALYNFGKRSNYEYQHNNNLDMSKMLTSYNERSTNEQFPNHNADYTFSFKHSFGQKMHELTADVFYSDAVKDFDSRYLTSFYDLNSQQIPILSNLPGDVQKTTSNNKNKNLTIQSDYFYPIKKTGKFEAGYKTTLHSADMDYTFLNYSNTDNSWKNDTNKTNHFVYNDAIHALYANYGDAFYVFKLQLGLRAEYATVNFSQEAKMVNKPKDYHKDYFNLFPTAHLKYEMNEFHSLNLSYSRRIHRPGYHDLNPFTDYEDPLNLSSGNPELDPEYSNSYEFGLTSIFSKTTLTSNVFYRQTDDVINRIRILLDSNVTMSSPKNMLNSKSMGIEFNLQQELFSWWKFDASGSYYKFLVSGSYIDSSRGTYKTVDLNSSNYSWNVRFNTNVTYEKALDFQLTGYYNGPTRSAQSSVKDMYSMDFGVKWSFLDGNASINFRLSDIFNTQRYAFSTYSYNFEIDAYRKRVSRTAFLGFTYKFNDYKKVNGKRNGNGNGDDIDIMDME